MAKRICAECGKEIDTVNHGYYKVLDNFLQTKYFDEQDGSDNVFCSTECVTNSLSIELLYDNEAE